MILADKIVDLRKKNGWSQEELAEKLEVSRQSVSKWEGAQSVPDLNRVLQLSELFGVSTDYLLKDELPDETAENPPLREDTGKPLRRVSMQQAQTFLRLRQKNAQRISIGVTLCILSPIALILLAAAQEAGRIRLSEQQAVGLGLLPLFLLVGAAVALFVVSGLSGKPFEFLGEECFETEYGVSGLVREQREQNHGAYVAQLVAGITLCVLSCVPIFAAMFLGADESGAASDFRYVVAVAALLCMVAVGVLLIVRASIVRGGYAVLLEEGEYSRESKQALERLKPVSAIYWGLMTAGYLGYSFFTMDWQRSWIIWPVAGVLYGVVYAVASTVQKKQ